MNTNKYLKYGIYGLIFAVPFIPFIVIDNFFFPFIVGKAFVFRILIELMVGLWIILVLSDSKYRPKFSWILALSALFVLIIGAADIFGDNPLKSIWSNFERMEGWITLVHLFGFLVVSTSVLRVEKLWHRFFNVSIFASVLMSFYGLLQLVNVFETHQGSRLDATLGNSAYLAVYMLIHIFLTLFLFLRSEKDSLIRWFYGGAMVLQTIALYNTATRGALLGIVIGFFITALYVILFEKENKKIKKVCIGSIAGIIILTGLFIGLKDSKLVQNSTVLKRFADISLQEGTTKARFMVWGMAWEGFKEKPILGWGQENFNYVFNKYYDPGMYQQEQWFDRTHNVFFDWLISGGLLGLLGYLSLFGVLIYYIIKDKNNNFTVIEKSIFIGMLTAYFVHNFFVFDHLVSYILFFSILGYIHNLNYNENKKIFSENVNENINRIAIPVVILATLFVVYSVNTKPILANISLLQSLVPHEEGVNKNLEYYEKAISYNSFGNQEIREQLSQMATKSAGVDLDLNIKQTIMIFAEREMLKQIEEDPENARLEVILGTSFASLGIYDEALVHLLRSSELSPKKQSILLLLDNVYRLKGDYEKSLEYAKKAFELDESFEDLRLNYGASAIYVGNESIVGELFGSDIPFDNRIIQAYFSTKKYIEAIKIVNSELVKNPNNQNAKLMLASLYAETGRRSEAIKEIQEVVEMNPSFKEQGDYYIEEINAGRNP